jgi:hypothetical protein
MGPRATVWLLGFVTLGAPGCGATITPASVGADSGASGAGRDAAQVIVDAAAPLPDLVTMDLTPIDDTWKLPAGVKPPLLWFWRGINQSNLMNWRSDPSGRHCADGDTTMWYWLPNAPKGGAPACDPDHFGTPTMPGTGPDCSWRNWDDPRGPEFRISNNTNPVDVTNWGARDSNNQLVPGYGFEVIVCAAPGTTARIDTCPRWDVHSCVETNYPQQTDQCDPVPIPVDVPPMGISPTIAGCYSLKSDVTIQF